MRLSCVVMFQKKRFPYTCTHKHHRKPLSTTELVTVKSTQHITLCGDPSQRSEKVLLRRTVSVKKSAGSVNVCSLVWSLQNET